MEIIVKLNNTSLLIKCFIEEYNEIIYHRLLMFDNADKYNNSLIIGNDRTIINVNGKKTIIDGKLEHTDLYQLINNILSNLINDNNNIYIHSCIIHNNKNTVMILGDFNAGKTTLAKYARSKGYKILSADQSWLTTNFELYKGSLYLAYNNTYEIIDKIDHGIKIDKILILQGITDGNLKFFKNNNYYHNLKQITKYCTWSTNNVLMTNDIELNLNKSIINNYLKKINIPVVYAIGKPCDIIKNMEELV